MPVWFFITIGLVIIVTIILEVVVRKKVKGKLRRLLAEMQRDDAVVFSECMVRNGAIECPGVAMVVNDTLIIHSVLDKIIEEPLANVSLIKERIGVGWYPWLGKSIFVLDTPKTSDLAIGVKEPSPWRRVFEKTAQK